MTTALFTHADCRNHVTPPGHPEQVARLKYVEAALADLEGLDRREAPLCADGDILRCHPQRYLDRIAGMARGSSMRIRGCRPVRCRRRGGPWAGRWRL